ADRDRSLELARRANHSHALAAATRRGLEQDREADPVRLLEGMRLVAQQPVRSRDRGQAVAAEQASRAFLGREPVDASGRRADERQVVGPHYLGEALLLAQEAVAG